MERIYQTDGILFQKDGVEVAKIQEVIGDELVCMTLSGSFSSDIANDLLDEMMALISVGKGIELNLAEVLHFAPTVNRVLLAVENRLEESGKIMRMVHVPESIYQSFRKSGMHELFEMELKK